MCWPSPEQAARIASTISPTPWRRSIPIATTSILTMSGTYAIATSEIAAEYCANLDAGAATAAATVPRAGAG